MSTMVSFSLGKREVIYVALLLLVAFVIRLLLFPLQGYQNDMGTFSYWFNTAASEGITTLLHLCASKRGLDRLPTLQRLPILRVWLLRQSLQHG